MNLTAETYLLTVTGTKPSNESSWMKDITTVSRKGMGSVATCDQPWGATRKKQYVPNQVLNLQNRFQPVKYVLQEDS